MKKLIIILALFLIYSCDNKKIEYYDSGKVKNIYSLKNGKYHGLFEGYDNLGNIKKVHIYHEGEKSDSSVYYKQTGNINRIDYYKAGVIAYRKELYDNGKIKEEGKMLKDQFPIGRWKYYDNEGYLAQIKEFINIQNQPYLNQDWVFDHKGDTISKKSNYYVIDFEKDTITLEEPIRSIVYLKAPLFKGKNSSIMVIVPKEYSENFNEDFSNLKEVIMDTTHNLNIEKDYRGQLGLEGNYQYSVFFGRYFNTPGLKKFRGIIVEYYYTEGMIPDSLNQNYYEHKKYFEKDIFVLDTIK